MNRISPALLGMVSLASIAEAQTAPSSTAGPQLTINRALELARVASPDIEAATANVRAAEAGQRVAGTRPKPSVSTEIENVGGPLTHEAIESPKQTLSIWLPIELAGKRSARLDVASAQTTRA